MRAFKLIFSLICVLGFFTNVIHAQAPSTMNGQNVRGQLQWIANYDQAVSMAKSQRKPILLFFTGSNWCGWCKKMDKEIFSSPDFISQMGNRFVFVVVDFPTNKPNPHEAQNNMLKQRFRITGFPTVVILDPNENFITETGYRPDGGKAFAEYLQQFVQ